jgi:hypothetical protein
LKLTDLLRCFLAFGIEFYRSAAEKNGLPKAANLSAAFRSSLFDLERSPGPEPLDAAARLLLRLAEDLRDSEQAMFAMSWEIEKLASEFLRDEFVRGPEITFEEPPAPR